MQEKDLSRAGREHVLKSRARGPGLNEKDTHEVRQTLHLTMSI